MQHYQSAVQLRPDYAEAWLFMGVTFYKSGNNADAERVFNMAISFNPSMTLAYKYLAAIAKSKNDLASYNNYTGMILAADKKTLESIPYFLEAAKINPSLYEAHFNAGLAYFAINNSLDAARHLELCVKTKPDFLEAYKQLENVYNKLGDSKKQENIKTIINSLEQNIVSK